MHCAGRACNVVLAELIMMVDMDENVWLATTIATEGTRLGGGVCSNSAVWLKTDTSLRFMEMFRRSARIRRRFGDRDLRMHTNSLILCVSAAAAVISLDQRRTNAHCKRSFSQTEARLELIAIARLSTPLLKPPRIIV